MEERDNVSGGCGGNVLQWVECTLSLAISRTIPLVGGGITRHFFQTLVAPCSSVAPGPTNLNHVQNK